MSEDKYIEINTSYGTFSGNLTESCREFLGIPYAKAERFRYSELIDHYEGILNAHHFGNSCPQYRQFFPHLDNPERLFYHREFREGLKFVYDEDCLNLNIYTPHNPEKCPVAVYFHGGGFNSGSNSEEPFRGYELAKRGVITVFANYRVGILGYLTHEEIQKEYGHNGNFGLDDMRNALLWVKKHIGEFGGDENNITLFGQSAGAMSIQYLCLNHDNDDLFQHVLMMSGAGRFPDFASPRPAVKTQEYWLSFMDTAGCRNLDELRNLDMYSMAVAVEIMKKRRKDTLYNTMPVIDGYLIRDSVKNLIESPLKKDYMIGYTNADMYAPMMALIGNRFGRANQAYIYYFDLDAPGDDNGAFHSSDLRYLFGRLNQSWRPYAARDYEVSGQMMDYFASFAKTGNPNHEGSPHWEPCSAKKANVLCFSKDQTAMRKPDLIRMGRNMIEKGNPKAK